MIKKVAKKKGILFWITGLPGSGKTTLGRTIYKDIIKLYGPTIMISGDDLRKIFKLSGYSKNDRLKIARIYCNFAKYITNQNINLIFAVVGLFDEPRRWNKKNIPNYIKIYIKSDIKKIIKLGKKKIYHKKNLKNIVGIDLNPEFPKKPDIIIPNFFELSKEKIPNIIIKKIQKILINIK